jgi:Tol biopolymer transport system component
MLTSSMRRFALLALLLPLAEARADVAPWSQQRISSAQFESHPAFDPRTGDFYFVRSAPDFSGWRIFVSRCTANGWSEPQPPSFAGDGVEADPFFTPDGNSLYFISTRTTDGVARKDLDIWRVDRNAKGTWGTPVRLPDPVNSSGQEWFPRLARDGWLYFGSSRPGGLGKTDIYRARQEAGGAWRVENLGPAINSEGNQYEAEISADGSRLILMREDGLYESTKLPDGSWSPRRKLGPAINVNRTEVGALLSPSGRSMLFARDTKGPDSGEFFLDHDPRDKDWPPRCPK